jgi:hypothetical protein
MSKSKEKFSAAMQEIEEYKDIAISRLDTFYSVIAEKFSQFDAKIDDEAKKRFPRICALAKNKQKLVTLGKSLHCNNCYVFVEEIDFNEITFRISERGDEECLRIDSIFAYATPTEFAEYIESLKVEIDEYEKYLKERKDSIHLSDKEKAEFEKYLKLKIKYGHLA